jgi:type I restriction enzyme S subunit
VLISSAGTVGKCDLVWKNHEERIASQDIIRVRAKRHKVLPGYLYTLFSSPLGSALLINQSAGSVIVRIYIEHLEGLEIPRLSNSVEENISAQVIASFEARAEARDLLNQAQARLIEDNSLAILPNRNEEEADCFSMSGSMLHEEASEVRLEAQFYNPIARAATENIRNCPAPKRTVRELTKRVFFCNRFTRTFVDAAHGLPYLAGKTIVQIRPTIEHHLSISQTEELDSYKLHRGWILVTCSGTLGRTCFVWKNFENFVATHDLIRVIPNEEEIDPGYLYVFLSSQYGYEQILRYRHGSVIDHVTPEQIEKVIVPVPDHILQKEIGDKVRLAYEKRAEAIKLEDEAQAIFMAEIEGHEAEEN